MRTTRSVLIVGSLPLFGAACDAESTNDFLRGLEPIPPAPVKDSGAAMPDAGGEVCTPTPPADCAGGAVVDKCSSAAREGTGTIKGTVTATATPQGGKETKGDLIISVLPLLDISSCAGKGPLPVASTIIHCADLTGGKAVPYEILGVPARDDAWIVTPYLDSNSNGLDLCDLFGFGPALLKDSGQSVEVELALSADGSALAPQQAKCGYKECK